DWVPQSAFTFPVDPIDPYWSGDPALNPDPATFDDSIVEQFADGTSSAKLILNIPALPPRGTYLVIYYSEEGETEKSHQLFSPLISSKAIIKLLKPGVSYSVWTQTIAANNQSTQLVEATGSPFEMPGDATIPEVPQNLVVTSPA